VSVRTGCARFGPWLEALEQIPPAQHALRGTLRQVGLGIGLVHQRDVVKYVLLIDEHLAHARIQNDRELTREGWVDLLGIFGPVIPVRRLVWD
jgi:hypothetical protein